MTRLVIDSAGRRAIPSRPKEVAMSDSAEVLQRKKDDVLAAARAAERHIARLAAAIAEIDPKGDVHFHELLDARSATGQAQSSVVNVATLAVKWGAR